MRLDAGAELTLSAYDYETSAQVSVPTTGGTEGTALVPGRLLAEIIRSLPDKPAELSTDGPHLLVQCGAAEFRLMLLPDDEYPALPALPPPAGTVGSDLLARAVSQVAVAAGKDDTLPALTGVHIKIDGDKLTMAATDRYRLAIRELKWNPAQPGLTATVLIPARALADATRAMTTAAEISVFLAAGASADLGGIAGFQAAGRTLTTRLLGGEYPRFQSLLPAEFSCAAKIPTELFTEAIKRVALVAERNTPVRLTFSDGHVRVEAGDGGEAQASEDLEVSFDGEDGFQIAFNPVYLADGLTAAGAATARVSFTNPTRPAVITSPEEGEQPSYRHVLMPIRSAG
jgi:DNA polymerase-3 subunit beta